MLDVTLGSTTTPCDGVSRRSFLQAGSLAIGFLLGGRNPGERSVMALGTAQRNVSAAILVTAQNFAGSATLPFVLVGAILLLLILLPTAKRMGAQQATTAQGTQPG